MGTKENAKSAKMGTQISKADVTTRIISVRIVKNTSIDISCLIVHIELINFNHVPTIIRFGRFNNRIINYQKSFTLLQGV